MSQKKLQVIDKHFDLLDRGLSDGYSMVVMEGSSRSGKTYSTAQWMILQALEKENLTVAVIREDGTTIKKTVWKDYRGNLRKLGLVKDKDYTINNVELVITFENGSTIFGCGANDEDKLGGLMSDFYHIDEATDCQYDSWKQVNQRCNVMGVLTYNPKYADHWLYDRICKRSDVLVGHSTYRDNPFLTKRLVGEIEAYNPDVEKNVLEGTADFYSWKVYGLGERAACEGRIFNNIKVDHDFFPTKEDASRHFYGLDFGFSNDPMALVECMEYDGKLYIRTLIYETGLTIVSDDPDDKDTLVSWLDAMNIEKGVPICCDSASPSSIESLRRKGYNAKTVRKVKDSIVKSIGILQSFIVRCPIDDKLMVEIQSYVWATKSNGDPFHPPRPVDKLNHAIDAARYACLCTYPNAVGSRDISSGPSRGRLILQKNRIEQRFGRQMATKICGMGNRHVL